MKLLICTQIVDKNHPILGFFHRWIEEFSKHFEVVHVICLQKGECYLPENVVVHSLGKETKPTSSVVYSWRLLKKAWELRKDYDAVFVHMIPEYVLAGAPAWMLLKKPVSLWYTHGAVSSSLKLANRFVRHIFTAAEEGMNLRSDKVVVTGHGIDFDQFANVYATKDLDMITVGRITPTKNLEELIDVLVLVKVKVPDATLTIVGSATTEADKAYQKKLEAKARELNLSGAVEFAGAVSHDELATWLSRSKVFVHAAKNGSLDKVLLEAIAARVPVVSNASGAKALPLRDWQVADTAAFADTVVNLLEASLDPKVEELYRYVTENHSLEALIRDLSKRMQTYGV